ncbi:uncharacterized protein EV420DRAFT_1666428 [Desarmillaria tabescens]|uniref:Uncharacterized protein n=1 Tax=Armillaria tabescens TaxID=1929756 RepID=A0AA39MKE6_ARMTA|nr:uncharacterized protein EV420DRAFT_1666428 [Desarmillaria tabescens]KAK0438136.1 hypothetical protein EV420DRAFT_1666428 [Desarmillaria tabescens]
MCHDTDLTRLQDAPYVVAFHENDRVRMMGFFDEASARTIYDYVSEEWAKILMDRRRSKVLESYGDSRWVKQCTEEVLKFDAFAVVRARDVSLLPDNAPYVVAFHQRDCVRMIGYSERGIAQTGYNSISNEWAKILVNRQHRELLTSYGNNHWSKQCEEEVQRLPAFDDTAPLQIAPYIVAFHQSDCVRMIGLYTAESAQAVYDAVSKEWAKVVSDRERSQVLASHGFDYYVKLCKERISQLDAFKFNRTVPLQHAPYIVTLHQSDRVRMVGFSKEESAWTVYNTVSNEWAKILMDRRRSQNLFSHGGARWIKQCKEEVLRVPLFENPILLSQSGPYVVAFHQNDCVRMIGLPTEGSARTVYDMISMEWAKILVDKRDSELLASYGSSYYTKQCGDEIRRLDTFQSIMPLRTASYIVAFHQSDRVRMLGFSEDRAARAVYGAVSDEWAKVLVNRRYSEMPLASYGSAYYVRQCEEEVLRL